MGMIRKVSINEFLPFVMVNAPDIPEAIAQAYIRQTCIDFARESCILRRIAEIDLQEGVGVYPLEATQADEEIVRVNAVSTNGIKHCDKSFDLIDGFIRVAPVSIDGVMQVEYTACPSRKACEVDEVLYTDWQQAIEFGTLSRILMVPTHSYINASLAMNYKAQYSSLIREARVSAIKRGKGAVTFVSMKKF